MGARESGLPESEVGPMTIRDEYRDKAKQLKKESQQ